MFERKWVVSLLHIQRLRLLGFMLGVAGISIALSPAHTFGITSFVQDTFGLHPYALGALMSLFWLGRLP